MIRRHKLKNSFSKGSALILTVVLASILAIVGVLFLLASRVETLSTSSVTDERDLNLAIDTIISKLSNELVLDTPGVAGSNAASDANLYEYYDYPGNNDPWLASIEPYNNGGTYEWRQISDLTGYLRQNYGSSAVHDVPVRAKKASGDVNTLPEYPPIVLGSSGNLLQQSADADGDGIADSKWFELADVMGSKGQKVYAAVRVIDNAGLININTAYKFDGNSLDVNDIDGRWLYQVNLNALRRNTDNANGIFFVRAGISSVPSDMGSALRAYELNGAWRLADPCNAYTPFDISDELELRYRFLISSPAIARIENTWDDTVSEKWTAVADRPFDGRSNWGLLDWQDRITDPNNFDRRHLLTTYNFDRIIAPDANGTPVSAGMTNVNFDPCNLDTKDDVYTETYSWNMARNFAVRCAKCVDRSVPVATRQNMKRQLAQLAVNMADLRDSDTDVTSLNLRDVDPCDFASDDYVYGIEPYPVITQVDIHSDPCDPLLNAYGVELFNPFDQQINLQNFELLLRYDDPNFNPSDPNSYATTWVSIPLVGALLPKTFYVVTNDPNRVLPVVGPRYEDSHLVFAEYDIVRDPNTGRVISATVTNTHNVEVARTILIPDSNDPNRTTPATIYPDRQLIYRDWVVWNGRDELRGYGRGFTLETAPWSDVVYSRVVLDSSPLGASMAALFTPRPTIDISVPYGRAEDLRTVGDIARIWSIGPTDKLRDPPDANDPNGIFDPNDPNNGAFGSVLYSYTVGEKLALVSINKAAGNPLDEALIRLNLADPLYANLFQYITVFDPRTDGVDNDGDGAIDEADELKVPGRININTAPAYVIRQLPWMEPNIAEAIVAYRDKESISGGPDYTSRPGTAGFKSIGELNLVADGPAAYSIGKYALEPGPTGFPDLTGSDGAENDFEERDLIFARISNLVTVRSDVFTAYILVRLGADGPQKRVVAILDRSNVYKPTDKVKVLALHDVSFPK
jgi:DNA uptake protein ComE-like DNA-binding protein